MTRSTWRETIFTTVFGLMLVVASIGGYMLAGESPDVPLTAPAAVSERWQKVDVQSGVSIRLPDGWRLMSYADYDESPHSLATRIDPMVQGDLLPSWDWPRPNIIQTAEDVSVGGLHGKRFTAYFTDTRQTKYEYVLDMKNGKKLEVLYTIAEGSKDESATVEKAVQTISRE
ncbi:MAG TPA: hypothetical protein VFK47_02045 [Ktedonobacteraceae bacterium]|nr:hypothetical protein [Ktedonobacteraceae bacterium]